MNPNWISDDVKEYFVCWGKGKGEGEGEEEGGECIVVI